MKGSVKLPVFIDDARKYVNTTQLRAKYLGASYEAEYCQWQTLHGLGSLMETASLIITPNAYLEGKIVASYPPDPIGDFNVTRATTATRVNSAGLVELVPYNLLQYSEQFNNGIWTPLNEVTITSNASTAPDGTMTADRLEGTGSSWFLAQQKSLSVGNSHTISMYVKSNTGSNQTFRLFGCGSLTSSNLTATNEWQRFEFTFTSTTDTPHGITRNSSNSTADLLVWGAQLVEGSTAKDYQKTETRLNIPRLDYSNGTCPSLLVEPQRTNSCLYSNKISNSTWLKYNDNGGSAPIITDNYGISPDGTQNAQRIQLVRTSTANSYSYILQNITGIAGQSYTWSVWLKSLSGTPSVALSNIGGSYANIVTLSNEWERYEFTTTTTGTGLQAMFLLFEALPSTSLTADFLAYGFQLEQGSYATSYIPTTSASVTRNADVISKTGISSLIGQTEGTIFWNAKKNLDGVDARLNLSDGTTNNWLFVGIEADNRPRIYCNVSGTNQFSIYGTQLSNDFHKLAFTYKANDFALYIDGVQVLTHTSGSVPACSRIDVAALYAGSGSATICNNKAVALWKTRLTNTQLAQLTTI